MVRSLVMPMPVSTTATSTLLEADHDAPPTREMPTGVDCASLTLASAGVAVPAGLTALTDTATSGTMRATVGSASSFRTCAGVRSAAKPAIEAVYRKRTSMPGTERAVLLTSRPRSRLAVRPRLLPRVPGRSTTMYGRAVVDRPMAAIGTMSVDAVGTVAASAPRAPGTSTTSDRATARMAASPAAAER